MKVNGYIVTRAKHKNCAGCVESAERAAILAKVTGSVQVKSHEPGHGATVVSPR